MPQPASVPDDSGEFFIGWLPMPARYRRPVRRAAATLVAGALAVAAAVAWMQPSPGEGQWTPSEPVELTGVVVADPYAMLRVVAPGGPAAGVRTVLLVESGKFGAVERMRPFDGQPARVRGTWLHRGDRWMLELDPATDAVVGLSGAEGLSAGAALRVVPRPLGPVVLRGEIIDPKCYLGAMKPGGGKTHKACAALCLRGGVPPLFVTRDAQRRETFYLLVRADGGPAHELAVPYVGDPVTLRAEAEQWGDLTVLKLTPQGIERH